MTVGQLRKALAHLDSSTPVTLWLTDHEESRLVDAHGQTEVLVSGSGRIMGLRLIASSQRSRFNPNDSGWKSRD